MTVFVYIYVILVILFGLIGLARAAYISARLRKKPKSGSIKPIGTHDRD